MHADGKFFVSNIVHGNRNDQVSGAVPTAQGNGWRYSLPSLNAGVEAALGGFVPSDVPQAEADTLISFWAAMGYPALANWGVDPVVDNWEGVGAGTGHVTSLSLVNKSLSGSVGSTLNGLSSVLTALDLSANISLSGVAYGTIWDQATDTYQTGYIINGTFIAGAVPLTCQLGMKRCVLSDAGAVQYYLLSTDSTKKADGTAATLDGTDGQVMVEIPKFYYVEAFYLTNRYLFVGDLPFSITLPDSSTVTAVIHPYFYKGGSATASDYRYVGAYEGALWDAGTSTIFTGADVIANVYAAGDKLCSVSGQYPKVSETITEFRAAAAARGAGWHQYDNAAHAALCMLYLTEFGHFNTQLKIGDGRTGLSGGAWTAGSYIAVAGLSNANGNATGNVSTDYMSYRGVENWYGNVWKFLDGANIHNSVADGSRLYLCNDHSKYASDTDTNYSLAGALVEIDGYPTDFLSALGFWPTAVGGNTITYLCDYYYTYFDDNPAIGWRVALVGGHANGGAGAGAFCLYSNSGSAIANANIGRQLSLFWTICAHPTMPLGKTQNDPHRCWYGDGRLRGE